ncbi:hypothetical protein BaRGS_00009544 [Batillaria attramentaria]|uniref:Alanine--tRNA ligase n=1 Tax=Batillaria attramentaria TaxID=370345 RepID=A0ABD0LJZ7_9CAEN
MFPLCKHVHPAACSLLVRCKRLHWSSSEVRSTFLQYFQNHDHLFVPSSSAIPHKGQGTYFTNAGMNQFKPVFLGTVDPRSEMATYRRVVNSQKCIRVGGKHNDLAEVGCDLTHHTFFEMLGNWSFGDYFKEEACKMAYELLTKEYKLPVERLCFTYFGGNTDLNLSPDTQCQDIWRSLGVPSDHILPFGMKDNFWDMGNTGPCGPCTEIHYDHVRPHAAGHLVNANSPDVVEIWNLVFMQYERHEDGSLSPLPSQHVDTGMGLERMLAVMNGSHSNYDSDLFTPLFDTIQKASGAPAYSGRVGADDAAGVDMAYRVLADHARMYTVAITDGLMPSRHGLGHKLRQLIYRCVRYTQKVFHTDPHLLCVLVDLVADSLGAAYPEIQQRKELVKAAVAITTENYLQLQKEARQSFQKMLRQEQCKHLTGERVLEITEGRYGCAVPLEMLQDLAEEHDVSVDVADFEHRLEKSKEQQNTAPLTAREVFSHSCFETLQQRDVLPTDDSFKYIYSSTQSGYDFSALDNIPCKVVGLVQGSDIIPATVEDTEVAVILDKTCFYAEGGGQAADVGVLVSESGRFEVKDVRQYHGYIVHFGKQVQGTLCEGQQVQPVLRQTERVECMRNHTATHLLQAALRKHLGQSVTQQGSNVRADRLTFDFLCLEYPAEVTLVCIGGDHNTVSKELCGGTHVMNTGDIQDFCITRVSSVSEGVRRVFAVTGHKAVEAHERGAELSELCKDFEGAVATKMCRAAELQEKSQRIRQMTLEELLPHAVRNHAISVIETLAQEVAATANREKQVLLREKVESLLQSDRDAAFLLYSMNFDGKQMLKAVSSLEADRPVGLVSCDKKSSVALIIWPQDLAPENSEAEIKEVLGNSNPAKFKAATSKSGASILLATVKGRDLGGWLSERVRQVLESTSR